MHILITGGLGFIGSNLAIELVKQGNKVSIIDNLMLGRKSNIDEIKDKADVVIGDYADKKKLAKFKNVDIVFHLAASSSSPMFQKDLSACYKNNVVGFIKLLEWAKDKKVKKLIYASTSSIYGNKKPPLKEDDNIIPPNFYSATKLAMEHLAQIFSSEHNLECIGFRFMSIYGPKEESKGIYANLVSQFIWEMQKGKNPILYGDGRQRRDLTYVDDLVKACVLAMKTKKRYNYTIFNIGVSKDYNLIELVKIINKVLKTNIKPKFVKNPVKNYIYTQKADLSKIKKELGYKPSISLEEGVKRLVDYYSKKK